MNGGTPVVYNYGYDSVWKDKLVSFDGKSLTYDQIGNPLTIGDSVLTWIQGRKLSTFKKDATSDTATYTYDENGIRKTKVVGDEVIEYITSGGEVVAQRSNNGTTADSSDDVVITFTRGADGSLISMNRNGIIYYYVTNIQGDVEKILDSSGNVVVSYVYDAYGRVVSISGTHASTIGEENPFRYRSYYFDSESGYYYLQSRYYDPVIGRFINADDRLVDNGNMFSYCNNNPVNQTDHDGHWPKLFNKIAGKIKNSINKAIKYVKENISSQTKIIISIKSTREYIEKNLLYNRKTGSRVIEEKIEGSKNNINGFTSSGLGQVGLGLEILQFSTKSEIEGITLENSVGVKIGKTIHSLSFGSTLYSNTFSYTSSTFDGFYTYELYTTYEINRIMLGVIVLVGVEISVVAGAATLIKAFQ